MRGVFLYEEDNNTDGVVSRYLDPNYLLSSVHLPSLTTAITKLSAVKPL